MSCSYKRRICIKGDADTDEPSTALVTKTCVFTPYEEDGINNPVADLERALVRIAKTLEMIYQRPEAVQLTSLTRSQRLDVEIMAGFKHEGPSAEETLGTEAAPTQQPTFVREPGEWIATIPQSCNALFDSNDVCAHEFWMRPLPSSAHPCETSFR